MNSPVLHFEIGGKDVNELIDFYSSTFCWNIFPLNNVFYIADPTSDQGIEGHLFQTTDQMDYTNLVIIYVQVDDIHSCLEKSEWLGGKILVHPVEIPGSTSHYAIFSDPNGNRIGLLQRRISDV